MGLVVQDFFMDKIGDWPGILVDSKQHQVATVGKTPAGDAVKTKTPFFICLLAKSHNGIPVAAFKSP